MLAQGEAAHPTWLYSSFIRPYCSTCSWGSNLKLRTALDRFSRHWAGSLVVSHLTPQQLREAVPQRVARLAALPLGDGVLVVQHSRLDTWN